LSDDDLAEDDVAGIRPRIFAELSHGGRVARVLVALALTAVGWMLPLPYLGYAYSGILFAPAAVLLFFALRGKRHRLLLFSFGAPTVLGLALSGLSCVIASKRGSRSIDDALAWSFVATLGAVLLGSPRIAGLRKWW
jgi:hypothetical protein